MADKAFDYAKEITITAIQNKGISFEPGSYKDNNHLYAEAVNEFFETVYNKLKELRELKELEKQQ